MDISKYINDNKKAVACIAVSVALLGTTSFAFTNDTQAPTSHASRSINRIELEGWEPDTRIVRDDGSVNYVVLKSKAGWVAKVLYGMARRNTLEQQQTVVWCIINRLENSAYPDTIEDVCSQPYQFDGFSYDNPIDEKLESVAYDVLYSYYVDGYKPVKSSYVYMETSEKNITLRDSFKMNSFTNYWRVET